MTRGLDSTLRHTLTLLLCAGALLVASPRAHAQDAAMPVTPEPTSVVESPDDREMAAGPPGVTLSLIGRTPGVPVVLHALRGTESFPLAALVVENTSAQVLTALTLAVTQTPPDGPPRRRLVLVPAPMLPGATTRVDLEAVEALAQLAGREGALEVAVAGAAAADGTRWAQSPGPVWTTGATTVACADADWQPLPAGTDLPDATTGTIVRCEADGRWRALGDAGRDR